MSITSNRPHVCIIYADKMEKYDDRKEDGQIVRHKKALVQTYSLLSKASNHVRAFGFNVIALSADGCKTELFKHVHN